ncbi:DUF4254 domain-containing protein [Nocardia arthritidis]|uniref:DUF4254 domain-containing protein n=1 Tax=Nocardia arthritidis TaxID=228602 RepID=A0A6G9Y9S4_9NOCA|nr:DUF4254 domain-containing protein [Nocardia arthritidis]QIS09827.1 DUF4254 domain-containing protein [Nocardia arthritidis]
MTTPLPSKDMILQACAGTVTIDHPVLLAAYELISLHEARRDAAPDAVGVIDRERSRWVRAIDSWVDGEKPPTFSAACVHTETVGMVVDRLAEFAVAARDTPASDPSGERVRSAQHRLDELALAYSDLAFEIASGVRRLPDFGFPAEDQDSNRA